MKAYSPPTDGRSISDRRFWLRGAGAIVLALLCVLTIALAQRAGWLAPIDRGVMLAAGRARTMAWGGDVTIIFQLATVVGDTVSRLSLLAGALIYLGLRQRGTAALWLAAMMAGGTLLNLGLKQIFAAPRPDLLQHLDFVTTYSFPSGHAAGNMMFFGGLALIAGWRPGFALAAIIVAVIGISRVWLGVHWPSDVAAGWIEGLGWLAFCAAWLPAGGREQQRALHAGVRGHSVASDEAVDPETVDHGRGGDQR